MQAAQAARDAAVAEMNRLKRSIQDMERDRECKHAFKTFSVDAFGGGQANAGGAKGRKARFEALDRLSKLKAGLSAGQKNDWGWFKETWDAKMLAERKGKWPELFASWLQAVVVDERFNAFSVFVHKETCRVLGGSAALQIPGK